MISNKTFNFIYPYVKSLKTAANDSLLISDRKKCRYR